MGHDGRIQTRKTDNQVPRSANPQVAAFQHHSLRSWSFGSLLHSTQIPQLMYRSRRSRIARFRTLPDRQSTNSRPLRWSISCWMQRASKPSPSITAGWPNRSTPLALAYCALGSGYHSPGMDRHPSSSSCSPSMASITGLTRCPICPSTLYAKTRRLTPIWLAARPARPGRDTVSPRSATRLASASSNLSTASQGVRSTGSPNRRMGRSDTVPSCLSLSLEAVGHPSDPFRPNLRTCHRAAVDPVVVAVRGSGLPQFSHGLTRRNRTMASMPDARQDSDLRIRILAHWPDARH